LLLKDILLFIFGFVNLKFVLKIIVY